MYRNQEALGIFYLDVGGLDSYLLAAALGIAPEDAKHMFRIAGRGSLPGGLRAHEQVDGIVVVELAQLDLDGPRPGPGR